MGKYVLIVACLVISALAATAQEPAQPIQRTITPEEGTKILVDHISPKLNLTKGQKDTLSIIFLQFMDDVQKYHAETNVKVFAYMVKTRDDRVKTLLRDTVKFSKYLLVLEDVKKQPLPQNDSKSPHQQGGMHNRTGGGGMGGGRTY